MSSIILDKLILLPGILLGISIHEFSHGFAAYKLGDDTPAKQGRLSLNPLKHLDILGFLCLLLVGFGWAKPVMIDPRNFKNPRRDDIIVSLAGPLSNFIVAFIFVGLMKLTGEFMNTGNFAHIMMLVFLYTVQINLVLMVFNLLPLPPLDGHHILGDIGGAPVWNFYHKHYDFLRFLMLVIIMSGVIFDFSILGKIISPPVNAMMNFMFEIFY